MGGGLSDERGAPVLARLDTGDPNVYELTAPETGVPRSSEIAPP